MAQVRLCLQSLVKLGCPLIPMLRMRHLHVTQKCGGSEACKAVKSSDQMPRLLLTTGYGEQKPLRQTRRVSCHLHSLGKFEQ